MNIRSIRKKLVKVYDLLCEAQAYCTDEDVDMKNPDVYWRIERAIQLLDEVLKELK